MAVTADRVVVELEARLGRYEAKLDGATRLFERNMNRIQRSAVSVETITRRAFAGVATAVGGIGLIALGRDAVQTAVAFKRFDQALTFATGSTEAAASEMAFLRDLADRLGVRLKNLAGDYIGLAAATRGTALAGEQTREIFETVSKAVIAAGGSPDQLTRALVALQQIVSKGNVSAEELRGQLGEALPGAFQIAARAMGVTTGKLNKMLEQGELLSTEFLPKFIAQLRDELPDAVEAADAKFARFMSALDDAKKVVADRFLDELTDGADDFATVLKRMEEDGTLAALGEGLAAVVQVAAAGAKALGGLIGAVQKLDKLSGRARFADRQILRSPLSTREEKAGAARREADRLRADALRIREREQSRDEALLKVLGRDTEAARVIRERMATRQAKIDAAKPKPAPTPKPPAKPPEQPVDDGSDGEDEKARKKREREEAARRRREAAGALAEARETVGIKAELARAEAELLAARQDLTTSAEDRARFEIEAIEAERRARSEELQAESAARDLELESRQLAGQLSAEEVASLKAQNAANSAKLSALNDQAASLRVAAVHQAEAERKAAEALDVQLSSLADQADLAQALLALATTTAERQELELRLLDLQRKEEEARLRAVTASESTASAAEKKAAQARLDALPRIYGAREEAVRRDNAGPLDRYRDELNRTAGDVNEGMEQIAVDGLRSLTDGLADAILGFRSLGDIAREVLAQIAADLIKLQIRRLVLSIVGGGGSPIPGFAEGGVIRGPGTGTSDSIVARVSNGEGIVNARAMRKLGSRGLDAINKGKVPHFAAGGTIRPLAGATIRPTNLAVAPSRPRSGAATTNSYSVGQMVFPNVRDERDARRVTKVASRQFFREGARATKQGIGG